MFFVFGGSFPETKMIKGDFWELGRDYKRSIKNLSGGNEIKPKKKRVKERRISLSFRICHIKCSEDLNLRIPADCLIHG
jgi:hypothetical protein